MSDTIVCRCEDVTVEQVTASIKEGACTPNDVKRLTRCGSGLCQSKECVDFVVKLIHQQTNMKQEEIGIHRYRMPLRPVALGVLAGKENGNESV